MASRGASSERCQRETSSRFWWYPDETHNPLYYSVAMLLGAYYNQAVKLFAMNDI